MKVNAYHSKKEGIEVYHTNNRCTEGNNIETYNWTAGTGNKRHCKNCQEINSK